MSTKAGLRTEIVVSTVLLLGAALLFAGFLLIKLTEHELLEERRHSLRQTAQLIASTNALPESLPDLLHPLIDDGDLVAWRLLASDLTTLMSYARKGSLPQDRLPMPITQLDRIDETLYYSSVWNPFEDSPPALLDLAVRFDENSQDILQLRFSLSSLVDQVHRAQQLMLIYVVMYGGVLCLFGIYVLNRNIVKPVLRLRAATSGVAQGELIPIEIPPGPGEIHQLAEDFNTMIAALRASRAETVTQIESLESANLALQQARDEVVRAEKLASVGQLAAGMAHEIGNPLSAVIGYLNLLKAELANPVSRDLVERSLNEAGRIDWLVRELLDYAAPTSHVPENFDPVAAYREAVGMLANQGALDGIELIDRAPLALGRVHMDRSRYIQVCVNLILNARDAMAAGGRLILEAQRQGDVMVIDITDSGQGIAPDLLTRIFEPFFTTKDPGRGRGLGLAVCQRLISEAGGRIDVRTSLGEGTMVTIRLPAVQEVV